MNIKLSEVRAGFLDLRWTPWRRLRRRPWRAPRAREGDPAPIQEIRADLWIFISVPVFLPRGKGPNTGKGSSWGRPFAAALPPRRPPLTEEKTKPRKNPNRGKTQTEENPEICFPRFGFFLG